MFGNIVIRTKFIPPVLKTNFFPRLNLKSLFNKISQYPLTILQAGPGYGKSTSLASYFQNKEVFWYSVDQGDGDVLTFLLHLIYTFNTVNPEIGERTLNFIREKGENNQNWLPLLNSLINEIWDYYRLDELYVIIDDYHHLLEQHKINQLVEHLIEHRPPNLHLIISTRVTPEFSLLAIWRVKDQVLEIRQEDLRLNQKEINQFFSNQYNYPISSTDAALIYNHTEGWIIALEMIWQGLKRGVPLEKIRNHSQTSLEHLFTYLAQEVLAKQKPEIREFLIKTSLLRIMTPDSCNFIRQNENSAEILNYLLHNGLFTFKLTLDKYRYHHLFHDLLRRNASEELANIDVMHKELAEFFLAGDDYEEAIYHGIKGSDYYSAARVLSEYAPEFLKKGRFKTFSEWFYSLPERIRESFPYLYLSKGDISRFSSNFHEALEWYSEARRIFQSKKDNLGLSNVFQKMALVYLDTVQPAQADKYLTKALALREKESNWEEITLVRLLAENLLNSGRAEEAHKLQEKIVELSEENTEYILDSRVKVRTGRLVQAEKILKKALKEEKDQPREQVGRAHRETYLLLSLIASFKGDSEKAIQYGKMGLEQGKRLNSEFTRAVAYMRLGHAYQISGQNYLNRAIDAYHQALQIVDQLDVIRGRAEALWGLTLINGYLLQETKMKRYGLEGIKICREAGDEWLGALIKIAMGVGYVALKDYPNAIHWVSDAVKTFDNCNDVYGKVMGQIWLTFLDLKIGEMEDFKNRLENVISTVEKCGYTFIFKSITLLGARDLNNLIPIFTEGYNLNIAPKYCQEILENFGIKPGLSHPGYTLRIQTLGKFKIYRGRDEITLKEWKRAKARTLLQILITNHNKLLSREFLAELLSPEKDEESALSDFKVALNALNNVLEPEREARATPFFITKHNSRYGLNQASNYELDINQFESLIKSGLEFIRTGDRAEAIKNLSKGIQFYQGDYLPEAIYQDWSRIERERLRKLYLKSAETLAGLYFDSAEYQQVISLCERMLNEEPCLEESYQLLMKAFSALGKISHAVQVYHRCSEILDKELGVQPSIETKKIFAQIKNGDGL